MRHRATGWLAVWLAWQAGLAGAAGWQTVPLGGGGYVIGLVEHPGGGGPLYCRTDVGGAFRWNAASGQWVSITDTIVPVSTVGASGLTGIPSIAVDPGDSNVVYVAAGGIYSSVHGIFASDNQGATWTQINSSIVMDGNGGFRTVGERLAVDPNNPDILWYGSSQDGLQKGTRSGGVWTWTQVPGASVPFGQVASGDKAGVTFVACDKNGGSTIVYAGVYDSVGTTGGVYMSPDGTTWSPVPGMAVARPGRGQVAANGTLYVTAGTAGVAKLLRGGTLTAITPTAGVNYRGLAVAPGDPVGETVYVAEQTSNQYGKIYRSVDGGLHWTTQYLNFNNLNYARAEPDGTPSLTGYWFGSVAALLVSPANANELWASDFFGVYRAQDAQNLGTANGCFWHVLQKGQEETVVESLKVPPAGAALMLGVADVGGFRYMDTAARPSGAAGNTFRTPSGGSTIGLDFSEANPTVWARTWVNGPHDSGSGAASGDGGVTWLQFGQIASKAVTNSSVAGVETWDLSTFVAKQKAKGVDTVTLVLCSGQASGNSTSSLVFDSREAATGDLWPKLVVNGANILNPIADGYVADAATNTNYGSASTLAVSYAWGNAPYTRWTYLKFDLSGAGAVTSAALQLNRRSASNSVQFTVGAYACLNTSWSEATITWNTRPGPLGGGSNPIGDPRYYDGATALAGGRIAVSSTDPNAMVWLAEGTTTLPRYSDDRGATWTVCSGAPASQMHNQFNPGVILQQLAADRANGNFYLAKFSGAGSGNHAIYRSTDGGATWGSCGTVPAGSYNVYRAQLVAAPAANELWVSDDGVDGTVKGGLWRSTDGGATWGSKLTGLTAVSQVTFGKAQSGFGYTVFINGYKDGVRGLYRSDDYGATWTRMGDAPTIADVLVLAGDRQVYGQVFAGTGGRGTFRWSDDAPRLAGRITWTGGGSATNWNEAANWDLGIPGPDDEAVFTNTGLVDNRVVALGANQSVSNLVFATIRTFTIGNTNDVVAANTLTLQRVDRQDVTGTEGIQTLAVPVVLSANSSWTVNGSASLRSTSAAGISGGAYTLTKLGVGQLQVGNNAYTNSTFVLEGSLLPTANTGIRGNLFVGSTDGSTTGSVTTTGSSLDRIGGAATVTVYPGSSVGFGSNEGYANLTIVGGAANVTYNYISGAVRMTGGTLTGGTGCSTPALSTYAADTTALVSLPDFSQYNAANWSWTIADGAAPIDLEMRAAVLGSKAAYTLTKNGTGVLLMNKSSGSSYVYLKTTVGAGTLLAGNTSGSATGHSLVQVNAGATLGGTGVVGGVAGYTNSNVSVVGASGNPATVAPGGIHAITGDHVFGTLTVGSGAQANSVTFGSHSKLRIRVGTGGNQDRLTVNGALNLVSTSDALELSVLDGARAGVYTLASATGGITDAFSAVTGLPAGAQLAATGTAIELLLPRRDTFIMVR